MLNSSPSFSEQENADLCENPNGEDDNLRGRIIRHDRQCEGQDPGQGRDPAGSAATDLRREAAGRRKDTRRLQHPEGVDASPGSPSERRSEEEEEEDVHEAQEDQAQAQEGEARGSAVLQGRWKWEGSEAEERVSFGELWSGDVHGESFR